MSQRSCTYLGTVKARGDSFLIHLGLDSWEGEMGIAGGGVKEKWQLRRYVAFLQGTVHLAFNDALEWGM